MQKVCHECAGSGRMINEPVPRPECAKCHGTGLVPINLRELVLQQGPVTELQ